MKLIRKNRQLSQAMELETLKAILPHVRDRSCAVDGGANIGLWTDVMAKEFETVVAFEPVTFSYDTLCQRTSAYVNVRAVRTALFDRACMVSMGHPPKRSASTSYHITGTGREADTEAVALDEFGLTSCGLLKLDLEGAELKALQGARTVIEWYRPIVVVECIDTQLQRYGDSADKLHEWLHDRGYRLFYKNYPNEVYRPC